MTKSVNGLIGYEGIEVINPDGSTEDAEEEAGRGRWKQEERDGYWKMMQKYIGSDITSMVTLPVIIFEPMTTLQKMAELMEYSHLLDMADKTQDPCMRMVYASTWAISVYYAYQRTWKPFNPILGETYEMTNHNGQPSPTNECCSRRERAFRLRLHFKAEIEITRQFNRLLPRRKDKSDT